MTGHRVISLIASATEIVAALGYREQLVGRSHECDYPADVAELPMCSEPKIDVHGSSRSIDEQVRGLVHDGLSVYRVDAKLLDRLRPSVIITQSQCEVCAVSLKDVEAAVCDVVSSQPKVVSLEPMGLEDVWSDILTVGEALGDRSRAEALVAELRSRLDALRAETAKQDHRPTLACVEWIDPLMNAGNWVPELVDIAGGKNLFGYAGKHSTDMTWDALIAADPDVIAVMPCGFDIPRTREEMPLLAERPEWRGLSAVRNNRVYLTDGNQYFNRPGPRLVESAEIFAELLHPGQFNFGHEGTGWIGYSE